MVWVVVCWLRCWGECRGFAQLREGSDDPPPLVRMGASAWADAMPKPASRPSRMVVIAKVRRRRETRCMKPKPLHQTPSGINTACLFKVLLVGKLPIAQYQSVQQIARAGTKASRFLDIPRFSPYHPVRKQHTITSKALGYDEAPPPAIRKENGASSLNLPSGDQPVFCRPAATPETVQRIR